MNTTRVLVSILIWTIIFITVLEILTAIIGFKSAVLAALALIIVQNALYGDLDD